MISIDVVSPNDHDSTLMFRWRNDPAIRDTSINQDYIPWHSHEKWFKAKKSDPHTVLIMLVIGEVRVGVGRLDLDEHNGAEFSIYLNPEMIGKKIGVEAIRALLKHGFEDLRLDTIYGKTKFSNAAARATFARAGMVPSFGSTQFVDFKMTRKTWEQLFLPD